MLSPLYGTLGPLGRSAQGELLTYSQRMAALFGANIAQWFKMADGSGTTVADSSGNSRAGSYSGSPNLSQAGMGDGLTGMVFDASNDYINAYSAGLASAMPTTAGAVGVWVKMSDSGVWTDGVQRFVCRFYNSDFSKFYAIYKSATNDQFVFNWQGTTKTATGQSWTDWTHVCLAWGSYFRAFINGVHVGTDTASPPAWSGGLYSTCAVLGHYYVGYAPSDHIWSGSMAHYMLLNVEPSPAQVALWATK
jgi:hypothetical protein